VSDVYDEATEREMAEREAAIARTRLVLTRSGGLFCTDCGDEIPHERRIAVPSARRCIDCETHRERLARKR